MAPPRALWAARRKRCRERTHGTQIPESRPRPVGGIIDELFRWLDSLSADAELEAEPRSPLRPRPGAAAPLEFTLDAIELERQRAAEVT
jgi:hypothetical protein